MNKQFDCNKLIEVLKNKIANGELYITESDLLAELCEASTFTENNNNDVDQTTSLLEAIYNNMDKVFVD